MRIGTLKIYKHGARGLAIYVPKWLINALGLKSGSELDASVEDGNKVVLKPVRVGKKT